MARAYRVKDVYPEYQEELRQLQQAGLLRKDPIPFACPKCGEQYNLVEDVNTSPAGVERHKQELIGELERSCPDHPGGLLPS